MATVVQIPRDPNEQGLLQIGQSFGAGLLKGLDVAEKRPLIKARIAESEAARKRSKAALASAKLLEEQRRVKVEFTLRGDLTGTRHFREIEPPGKGVTNAEVLSKALSTPDKTILPEDITIFKTGSTAEGHEAPTFLPLTVDNLPDDVDEFTRQSIKAMNLPPGTQVAKITREGRTRFEVIGERSLVPYVLVDDQGKKIRLLGRSTPEAAQEAADFASFEGAPTFALTDVEFLRGRQAAKAGKFAAAPTPKEKEQSFTIFSKDDKEIGQATAKNHSEALAVFKALHPEEAKLVSHARTPTEWAAVQRARGQGKTPGRIKFLQKDGTRIEAPVIYNTIDKTVEVIKTDEPGLEVLKVPLLKELMADIRYRILSGGEFTVLEATIFLENTRLELTERLGPAAAEMAMIAFEGLKPIEEARQLAFLDKWLDRKQEEESTTNGGSQQTFRAMARDATRGYRKLIAEAGNDPEKLKIAKVWARKWNSLLAAVFPNDPSRWAPTHHDVDGVTTTLPLENKDLAERRRRQLNLSGGPIGSFKAAADTIKVEVLSGVYSERSKQELLDEADNIRGANGDWGFLRHLTPAERNLLAIGFSDMLLGGGRDMFSLMEKRSREPTKTKIKRTPSGLRESIKIREMLRQNFKPLTPGAR